MKWKFVCSFDEHLNLGPFNQRHILSCNVSIEITSRFVTYTCTMSMMQLKYLLLLSVQWRQKFHQDLWDILDFVCLLNMFLFIIWNSFFSRIICLMNSTRLGTNYPKSKAFDFQFKKINETKPMLVFWVSFHPTAHSVGNLLNNFETLVQDVASRNFLTTFWVR